ncbi:hypothetical protein AORI_2972 [Amycolatopsis keratiniphila]|uniref:Uncharacterized protein n=1 Tax=Amycolatopsis keratiniphila TaxID=129921 RepID=R4T4G1_9PSEU|nr:hypothetical protein AORI_2972 [Amycolatopsis keratiniphila]
MTRHRNLRDIEHCPGRATARERDPAPHSTTVGVGGVRRAVRLTAYGRSRLRVSAGFTPASPDGHLLTLWRTR